MSTETDLPRKIAPSEVRVGDEVEIGRTCPTLTRITRATVREVGPTGFVIGDGAESEAFSFPHWRNNETLTLLSRPTSRGPAWDAPMGSLWTDGESVWVRTDRSPADDAIGDADKIDSLVPYRTDEDELRDAVVEAALAYCDVPAETVAAQAWHSMEFAVSALRDHRAKS